MPYIGNIVQDFSVNNAMLNTDSVTSIKIDDGTIVNADINDSAAIAMSKLALSITNSEINASAAIAGTKISPDFGSQNIVTTGDLTVSGGDITLNGTSCLLNFNDTNNNPDFRIQVESGNFLIEDATNSYADRFVINSSGNIGIGTASPETLLHAKINTFSDDINKVALTLSNNQSSGVHQYFQNASTGTGVSNGARIGLGNTDNFLIQHFEAKDIQISTNGSERMRINSSGNVGIGTTTINTAQDKALSIFGTNGSELKLQATNFGGTAADGGASLTCTFGSLFITNNNANGDIHFQTKVSGQSTSEKMRLTEAGNLGIGTTSPQRLLHQHVSSSAANYHSFTNDTTGSGSTNGLLIGINNDEDSFVWNYENTNLRFGTNNSERMRIDSSGNVGIGTTSPQVKLDTTGTGVIAKFKSTNNNYILSLLGNNASQQSFIGTTSAGDMVFATGSGVSERIRIREGGGLTFNGDTAAANALDDYEEGSWTATMHDGNGSNVVLTSQDNKYTKIGRLLIVTGNITLNDTGKSGGIVLTNLPFTAGGFSQLAVGHFWVDRSAPNVDTIGGVMYATASNTSAYFVNPTGGASGGGNADDRYFQFADWANGRHIYFSLTYQTA
jgi:hypothetical protein